MSAARTWMALTPHGNLIRPESAKANLTAFCPHCGGGFSIHAGPQRMAHFTHASTHECRQKNWGLLAIRCAELLNASASPGVKLVAKGNHVRVVAGPDEVRGKVLLEIASRESKRPLAALTMVNANKFSGCGEHLAVYLKAAKGTLAAVHGVESPAQPAVVAVEVEPAGVESTVPAAPVAALAPAPQAPAPEVEAVGEVAVSAPAPAVGNTLPCPAKLPPLFFKNLAMRGLRWEDVPQWVVEPVPTAPAISHSYLDWQMAIIVLVVERPKTGHSRSTGFVADYLIRNKSMATEVERLALEQCAKELFVRLCAEGYLSPISGSGGFAKRTDKPCPWPAAR